MSLFSPRRYQPAYYPYTRDTLPVRAFTTFERWAKGVGFSCRMCGNCILQETAFICPMTCPKGVRNGPCGGSTPEHCYVDETRPCTWYKIYERSERMGRTARLLEVNAPLDGRKVGHETWLDLIRVYRDKGHHINPLDFVANRERFSEAWDRFFYDVRQPDWWMGDDQYHAPAHPEPVSELERSLRAGRFTVTGEIAPPLTANTDPMVKKARLIHDYVVAANFTDNASATPRMSSLASAVKCLETGLEPVLQLAARDRTRYAIEFGSARRRGAWRTQYPVPVGRPPAPRPGADAQAGSERHGRHPGAVDAAAHARRRHLPGRARDEDPAEVLPRRGGLSLRRLSPLRGHPRGEEGQCRGAVHPDAAGVRLRPLHRLAGSSRQAQRTRQGLHPAGDHSAQERQGRPSDGRRPRRGLAARTLRSAWTTPRTRRKKAWPSRSRSSRSCAPPRGSTGCTSWRSTGRRSSRG